MHDGGHVGKVEVDESGHIDKFGNALHTAAEHVVGDLKGIEQRDARIGYLLQSFIRDDNERIDVLAELAYALLCLTHTAAALKDKGLCHDSDGQNVHFLRYACNYRSGSGPRAAAHTGSR